MGCGSSAAATGQPPVAAKYEESSSDNQSQKEPATKAETKKEAPVTKKEEPAPKEAAPAASRSDGKSRRMSAKTKILQVHCPLVYHWSIIAVIMTLLRRCAQKAGWKSVRRTASVWSAGRSGEQTLKMQP